MYCLWLLLHLHSQTEGLQQRLYSPTKPKIAAIYRRNFLTPAWSKWALEKMVSVTLWNSYCCPLVFIFQWDRQWGAAALLVCPGVLCWGAHYRMPAYWPPRPQGSWTEIGRLEFWGWSSLIWSSLHSCLSVLYKYNKNFLCVPWLVEGWDALRQESVPPIFIFSSLFPDTLPAGSCLPLLMEITDLGFSLKCSFLLLSL